MKEIRKILEENRLIIAPGVYDALSIKLVEKAGFYLAYLSSYGISLTSMCKPDIGLMTLSELIREAKYVCEVTKTPIIADGEAGFGNAINTIRLVNSLENLGIAGTDIQDQRLPRTLYLRRELVPIEEYVKKIKAALNARKSRKFMIIGRTETSDLNEAIKRLKAYSEVGADMIFPHSEWALTDLEKIASAVKMPMVLNYPLIKFGKSKPTMFKLKNPWFKIVLFPVSALFASIKANVEALRKIKNEGKDKNCDMVSFDYVDKLVNSKMFNELERIYIPQVKRQDKGHFY